MSLTADMEIDFHAEKDDVFLENWTILDQGFYDENHHGADWDGIRDHWAPVIEGTRNRQEMRRALLLMTGELNGSHLGVNGSESPSTPQVGRLGLRFDRAAYEGSGRLIVTEVLPLSPAAVSGEGRRREPSGGCEWHDHRWWDQPESGASRDRRRAHGAYRVRHAGR